MTLDFSSLRIDVKCRLIGNSYLVGFGNGCALFIDVLKLEVKVYQCFKFSQLYANLTHITKISNINKIFHFPNLTQFPFCFSNSIVLVSCLMQLLGWEVKKSWTFCPEPIFSFFPSFLLFFFSLAQNSTKVLFLQQ